MRAAKLYELYRTQTASPVTASERADLEKALFRVPLDGSGTRRCPTPPAGTGEDPAPERDPKQTGPVFRWYLGMSSHWANRRATRTVDYQIWCGPAMGAFNDGRGARSWNGPKIAG